MDPNPDYDASDEIEYFFSYLTWGCGGSSAVMATRRPPTRRSNSPHRTCRRI